MYLISFYDKNTENVESIKVKIKSILSKHRINKLFVMEISDFEQYRLSSFENDNSHFMFVSLAMPNALVLAENISRKNPFCKIIFYGEYGTDFNRIIACRPLALMKNAEDTAFFEQLFEKEFDGISQSSNYIFLETKKTQIILPVKKIIYFSSEGHYINAVNSETKLNERFKYKLDMLQSVVSDCVFLRIHKSYLVSMLHISKLDKTQHIILMDNGEKLPVSDYYYKNVVKKIRQFCPLEL